MSEAPAAGEPARAEPAAGRALPRVRTDPEEQLTGRELRGLTARVTAAHAGRGAGQVVTDVAYVVVSVLLAGALVGGVVDALGDVVTAPRAWTVGAERPVGAAWSGRGEPFDPGLLGLLLGLVLAALVATTAARLGPAGVGTAGVHWWVPTPADRRGLLLPSVVQGIAWGVLAGAVGAGLVALATGAAAGTALLAALVGAPAGALLVALAGLLQPRPRASRALAVAGDVLVAAVPVLGLVLVGLGAGTASGTGTGAAGAPSGGLPAAGLVAAAVLAVLAVAVAAVWGARVDRLGAAALATRSGALDRLGAALFSADSRDLGRALAATGATAARPSRPRTPRRFRLVRGPRGAIVAADLVLLARTPAVWAQLVGLVGLLALSHRIPGLAAGAGLGIVVLAAGTRAAQLGAAGARAAEMVPALDASLPLSGRGVRAARTVVPALLAAGCLGLGLVPTALATGSPAWVVLGVLVGLGCGAAAVRAALRPEPDWAGPLLATPAGAIPVNAAAAMRQGPDLVLLTALPLAVAVLLGVATPGIVAAQGVVALVACAVAAHAPARRRPRLGDAGRVEPPSERPRSVEPR